MKKRITKINLEEHLHKIQKYELTLRKSIQGTVSGEVLSMVKGTGLDFDEVRPYQYGDDVRVIDWNVTAKGHGTFIKTFKEEKDQTVLVLYDLSASTLTHCARKAQKIKELASVLYLSALHMGSSVVFAGFTDKIEHFSKISKSKVSGISNVVRILKSKAESKKTDIGKSMLLASRLLNKRSLVLVISDFIDLNFEKEALQLAKKHEVVFIKIEDKQEIENIPLGIVPSRNAETGKLAINIKSLWFNLGADKEKITKRESEFVQFVNSSSIDLVSVNLEEDYTQKLLNFFKRRKLKR